VGLVPRLRCLHRSRFPVCPCRCVGVAPVQAGTAVLAPSRALFAPPSPSFNLGFSSHIFHFGARSAGALGPSRLLRASCSLLLSTIHVHTTVRCVVYYRG
jgi:hypothetical protein